MKAKLQQPDFVAAAHGTAMAEPPCKLGLSADTRFILFAEDGCPFEL